MPHHDHLADGKNDPGPGVLFAVQALEDLEQAVGVRHVDADADVGYGEVPVAAVAPATDADLGRCDDAELHGVGNNVLEDLPELDAVGRHGGHLVDGDLRL